MAAPITSPSKQRRRATQRTNMVHCELGLPEAEGLDADPRYSLVVQAK